MQNIETRKRPVQDVSILVTDRHPSRQDQHFFLVNGAILALLTLIVLIPLIYILACSFSSPGAVAGGKVLLWPVEFSTQGYQKDIVMCDWHYGLHGAYKSVDLFADAGFDILFSPWRIPENALAFYQYAKEHDRGHVQGLLATTWCSSGELARAILKGEPPRWDKTPAVVEALNAVLFENP